jgi:MFS superfamily sulfate permease-like transporter
MHPLPVSPASWWFLHYQGQLFRCDLVAGLTAAAVVIPKAMAYASIAGLPLEVGLYTALVPMVIYAVLGTSRPLSVSTTSTIAILTAAQLASIAPGGSPAQLMTAATTLALVVGVMLVLASVFRLGFLANFISDPVLTGFKSGIGLVIVVDQLPKLLGLHIAKGPLLQNLVQVVAHVPETSVPTLALGVGTLGLIFGLEHGAPRLPAPLVAAGAGIALSGVLGLSAVGVDTVGAFSTGLPGLVWPNLALVPDLWPGALGIALMSFTETIAAGRAFARPGEPRPQADRELLALGMANTIGA